MRIWWLAVILLLSTLVAADLTTLPPPSVNPPSAPVSAPVVTATSQANNSTAPFVVPPSTQPTTQPATTPSTTTQQPPLQQPETTPPLEEEPAQSGSFFSSLTGISIMIILALIIVATVAVLLRHKTNPYDEIRPPVAPRIPPPAAPQFPPVQHTPSPMQTAPQPQTPAQPVTPYNVIPVHLDPQKLQDAKSHINEMRGMGMKDSEILDLLKEAGWPAAYITRGLSELERGPL